MGSVLCKCGGPGSYFFLPSFSAVYLGISAKHYSAFIAFLTVFVIRHVEKWLTLSRTRKKYFFSECGPINVGGVA